MACSRSRLSAGSETFAPTDLPGGRFFSFVHGIRGLSSAVRSGILENETGDTGGLAKAALDELGGPLPACERPEGDEGPERHRVFRSEERLLAGWARAQGLIVPIIPESPEDGKERRVRLDPGSGLIEKATHPGSYGGQLGSIIEVHGGGFAEHARLLQATPCEYLDRIVPHNTVFGSDTRLSGVAMTPEGPSIVTRESARPGRAAGGLPASGQG